MRYLRPLSMELCCAACSGFGSIPLVWNRNPRPWICLSPAGDLELTPFAFAGINVHFKKTIR